MNHSSDPQASAPQPLSGAVPRPSRAFPWGFAFMLILLNLIALVCMIFILPRTLDMYAQLGMSLSPPHRMLATLSRWVADRYIPFGFLMNAAALTGLILAYRRWVMAKPWLKWTLLLMVAVVFGVIYLSFAGSLGALAPIRPEQ